MLVFSGTSYLGLDRHLDFLALVKEGLDRYGTNYGGSRLSPLCPEVFLAAEAALAAWVGAPAALLVGSGSAAGQLAARYLARENLPLLISPLAHPALWWPQGKKYASWEQLLMALGNEASTVFTDAIDPLKIQLPPWAELLQARPRRLVVDDSHTLGWYGHHHAGSWRELAARFSGELLITASLGKALALPAGVIFGEEETLAKLRQLPQFGGASPPAPAFLHAWLHGQEIIEGQQEKLRTHLEDLQPVISTLPTVHYLAGFPVFGLTNRLWGERLRQKGILISAFRYPNEDSPLYSRIVVRADHTREEISYLKECLLEISSGEG